MQSIINNARQQFEKLSKNKLTKLKLSAHCDQCCIYSLLCSNMEQQISERKQL